MPLPKPIRRVLTPYWQANGLKVYVGDCVKLLQRMPAQSVDLVFADPPFNIGYQYDEYVDVLPPEGYLDWTEQWLRGCKRLLTEEGSILVAIGTKYQAEVKCLMSQVGLHWRDTICWHYTFGPRQSKKLTPSWVAIHYFTNHHKHWTWNGDVIKVPSARQLKYSDRRAQAGGKVPDNVWTLLPGEFDGVGCFEPGQNTWLHSRVCGTYKERVVDTNGTLHPCQMPLALLERVILMVSNPGQVVLDPFLGSGTTLVAAQQLGRQGIGIELSSEYVERVAVPRLDLGARQGP